MSRKIIGVTVGTPLSPAKIAEKLKPVKTVNGTAPDENGNVEVAGGGNSIYYATTNVSYNDLDEPYIPMYEYGEDDEVIGQYIQTNGRNIQTGDLIISANKMLCRVLRPSTGGRLWVEELDSLKGNPGEVTLTEENKADIIADVLASIPAADWVEYIESDGTQYINTGFVPGGDTKVVIDAEYVSNEHSGADAMFGARNGTSGSFALMRPGSSSTTLRSDYNATMDATFPAVGSDRAVYIKDHGFTYMNGELVSTVPVATFSSKYEMYLMAVNSQNSARFPSALRIYSCQIYDNGKLVRDFIPWRTLNGTVGLYDRVHGKLYTDANGGKFGWGAKAGTTVSGMAQYATEAEVQTMIADALAGITNVSGVAM